MDLTPDLDNEGNNNAEFDSNANVKKNQKNLSLKFRLFNQIILFINSYALEIMMYSLNIKYNSIATHFPTSTTDSEIIISNIVGQKILGNIGSTGSFISSFFKFYNWTNDSYKTLIEYPMSEFRKKNRFKGMIKTILIILALSIPLITSSLILSITPLISSNFLFSSFIHMASVLLLVISMIGFSKLYNTIYTQINSNFKGEENKAKRFLAKTGFLLAIAVFSVAMWSLETYLKISLDSNLMHIQFLIGFISKFAFITSVAIVARLVLKELFTNKQNKQVLFQDYNKTIDQTQEDFNKLSKKEKRFTLVKLAAYFIIFFALSSALQYGVHFANAFLINSFINELFLSAIMTNSLSVLFCFNAIIGDQMSSIFLGSSTLVTFSPKDDFKILGSSKNSAPAKYYALVAMTVVTSCLALGYSAVNTLLSLSQIDNAIISSIFTNNFSPLLTSLFVVTSYVMSILVNRASIELEYLNSTEINKLEEIKSIGG